MNSIYKRRLAKADGQQYKILVEGISDYAIYLLDTEGVVVTWNLGAQRLKGYTEDEIVGRHFSTFYSDSDCEANVPATALDTAAMQGRFECEGWRLRKDGSQFWAHVIIDAIYDDYGELIRFAKITRDLSDRKKVEDELRKSEDQFRLLLQGVTDYAIYILDVQGIVASWNLGAERIKGFQRDEIIGEHFSRFYTPEDVAAGEPAKTLDTAKQRGRYESDGWRIRKDGSRFWANVVVDAIRNDDGELVGFAKITRDITAKLKAAQAHEETREQLFQAQKMEAIGHLTGGIAHDFNNILMAVMGGLNLLRSRIPENPVTDSLIANALRATEQGATLTKQLLAFARKQKLQYETIDLVALIHESLSMIQIALGSSVTMAVDVPLGLSKVRSDQSQLASAILNLALNARDAMSDGGTVTIRARVKKREGRDSVCLSVIDQGMGMDEATLADAVLPFYTTKAVGKGTGLGLSMVKGFMEESGGKLVFVSQRGVGTEAQLWLPLASISKKTVGAREHETATHEELQALKILAVDDDPLVLMNTVLMLEDLGHEVMASPSAEEALILLESTASFDVIVTDHAMPHMTGSQLADILGNRNPRIPCILTTGYVDLNVGTNVLSVLEKPFTQAELGETLQAALAKTGGKNGSFAREPAVSYE